MPQNKHTTTIDKKETDRRLHRRVRANFIIIYRLHEPLEVKVIVNKREVSALMLDLSVGGLALLTEYEFDSNTRLDMHFTLINSTTSNLDYRIRTIDISGEVRYRIGISKKEQRLGIQFSQMLKEDRQAITEFVKLTKEVAP